MMPSVHTETVREREIKSLCNPACRNMFKNLTFRRDLVESLERIDVLEGENQQLLSALRALATSPSFQPSEHDHIVQILSKVWPGGLLQWRSPALISRN
jgi:hypothetical protein